MSLWKPTLADVNRLVAASRIQVQGGRVVTEHGVSRADVQIIDGVIQALGPNLPPLPNAETIDATGLHVLPGAIDTHVHFREPNPNNPAETLRSGSLAAAAGGVTAFCDMPNTTPPTTTLARLAEKQALAARQSVLDYGFFVALSTTDREALRQLAATSIPGIKAYFGGTTAAHALSEDDLACVFELAASLGVPVTVHAEDDAVINRNLRVATERGQLGEPAIHARIRDVESCVNATRKAIGLAQQFGVHVHIAHLTTAAEIDLIADARKSGLRVTSETTLHHLLFSDADYLRLGHFLKCNPSVKSDTDRQALWAGLRAGVIDFIATDHAPHPIEQKRRGYLEAPSGVPAVELVLPLLLNEVNEGHCSLPEVVLWTAINPAKIYGIDRKRGLSVGGDADVVVVDLERSQVVNHVRSKCGHSPWFGTLLKGWPILTLSHGKPVFAADIDFEPPLGRPLTFTHHA